MNFKNENLTRQSDLIPLNVLGEQITIIGAGAIGGWTALALAKMGFLNLLVYDMDKIEVVNLNSQFYRYSDIGKNKAIALKDLIKDFTGYEINVVPEEYKSGTFKGIVISAVDSMKVRKLIWENHKTSFITKAVIDPRMGAETALMYVVKPNDAHYEKSLYTDENAVFEPCTAKSTIYCANILSGMVAAQVKAITTGNPYIKNLNYNIPSGSYQSWLSEKKNEKSI